MSASPSPSSPKEPAAPSPCGPSRWTSACPSWITPRHEPSSSSIRAAAWFDIAWRCCGTTGAASLTRMFDSTSRRAHSRARRETSRRAFHRSDPRRRRLQDRVPRGRTPTLGPSGSTEASDEEFVVEEGDPPPCVPAIATADYPTLRVTDVACEGASKPSLWKQLSVNALNEQLARAPTNAETRMQQTGVWTDRFRRRRRCVRHVGGPTGLGVGLEGGGTHGAVPRGVQRRGDPRGVAAADA